MKKLYIIALLGLLIPSISQATLYDYYSGIGKNLPSITERSVVYSEVSDEEYFGTAEQNNALESYLRGSEVLGATTKIKLTDSNSVTPYATSTPTAGKIPMADGNGKLDSGWILVPNSVSLTAGESITAGNAVSILGSTDNVSTTISQTTHDSTENPGATTNWKGQTVTLPSNFKSLKQVVWGTNFFSSRTYTLQVKATSGGLPTGAVIASSTATLSTGLATFTFATAVDLDAGSQYAFTISADLANSDYLFQSTDVYSGGSRITSSDSGSNWSTTTGDYYFTFLYYNEGGKIYKAKASNNDALFSKFVGFALEGGDYGDNINISVNGLANNLTGLTLGSTYYLSDTAGAIGTSAGSNSKKVGIALSATELLIKNDN